MIESISGLQAGKLQVKIYENRQSMGEGAADDVANKIKELLNQKKELNIIFAAAPSQNEFLAALSKTEGIDWTRINAFHMDEYVGLDPKAPQRFGQFLKMRLFDKVPLHEVYYLDSYTNDVEEICNNYTELLAQHPTDIVCMGIGENAHIAFNDPHVADFKDPQRVKLVQLDEASRIQQVHDDCFERLEDVPDTAITLTVPALLQARYIYCMVPGNHKAEAVYHTLNDEIKEDYPSTILRQHPDATLYLDKESAKKLNEKY